MSDVNWLKWNEKVLRGSSVQDFTMDVGMMKRSLSMQILWTLMSRNECEDSAPSWLMAFPLIFWQHYSWSWWLRCEVERQWRRSVENVLLEINFSWWKAEIIGNLNDASRNPAEVYNLIKKLGFKYDEMSFSEEEK